MATRVCPQCGTQYVASVRRCIDCDAMLVDDVGPGGESGPTVATPVRAGDQIAYELDGWGNQLRVTLAGMLDLHEVPHIWEVGALVVAASHEQTVDELIAAVEGGEGEELEADVPQVEFEIEGVSADELAALDAELIAAHIPHAWQETGELLVPEESEDDVADIIDSVLNPPEEGEEDGLAIHAALDALYVAVDRLSKDPSDQKLVARYATAADALDGLGVPYGMSGNDWEALGAQVAALRAALHPPVDDDASDDTSDTDADPDAETGDGDDTSSADGPGDETGAEGSSDDADPAPEVDRITLARDLIGPLRTRLLDLV